MTREGPGISRGRAAVLLTTFAFLLNAAGANAHPRLELSESSARAGSVVHFTSSEASSLVYELAVDDEDVLEDTGGGVVSGAFTMPDLGDDTRSVTVEGEVGKPDKQKKVKRKLEYLGPALPVADPPPPAAPLAVPVAAPPAAPAAEPIRSPKAIEGASLAPALTPRSNRSPANRSRLRVAAAPGHVAGSGERRRRGRGGRNGARRSKRPGARTAPLFDGIPEPGVGNGGVEDGFFALNAIAPRSAELGATASLAGDDRVNAAVVVPGLAGLAALALAGIAVLRKRRLASSGL